jgi:lipid II:glycine glycyltransferase (peptidoglycan interpeptide bridge formation enzyme)
LRVQWDDRGTFFPLLLKAYNQDKAQKGYDGPSSKLLEALAGTFLRGKNMLIGLAALDGKPVAGILVLCHGSAATYQVGWISPKGREKQAGHVLLWDALRILKERNINDFDLGGVNDGSAHGVKSFKSGMGGDMVEIPGLYV